MPRIRTLKPETASDRKLASVSRDARYTFVLLISQADDDGLLRAEPRQLLGALYPFDHDVSGPKLEHWLAELCQKDMIRWRRTLDGVRVIEIVNWSKHQFIKNRSIPFLLTQLAPLTETETGLSVEPTEEGSSPSVEAGGAEPRVLSPEPRVPFTAGAVNGHSNGSAKPAPKRRPSRDPPAEPAVHWVQEAVQLYAQHIGEVAHAKAGKLMKPLVDKRGWDEVKPVFAYFCEFSPVQKYLARVEAGTVRDGEQPVREVGYQQSIQAFVESYTHWAKQVSA